MFLRNALLSFPLIKISLNSFLAKTINRHSSKQVIVAFLGYSKTKAVSPKHYPLSNFLASTKSRSGILPKGFG